MLDNPGSRQIRVWMCLRCGSPIRIPLDGGRFSCDHCHKTIDVSERDLSPLRIPDPILDSLSSEDRESKRVESLFAQSKSYRASPYNIMIAPRGMEELDQMGPLDPAFPAMAHQAFLATARRLHGAEGTMPEQRELIWLAEKIRVAWERRGEPDRARAVAEMVHDLVTDPGFRQSAKLMLSATARRSHDLDSAQEWLDECDPAPALLDLDCDYRVEQAILCLRRTECKKALSLVGQNRGQVACDPANEALFGSVRISAFEQLGHRDRAESELKRLLPENSELLRDMYGTGGAWQPCQTVWLRIEDKKRADQVQKVEDKKRRELEDLTKTKEFHVDHDWLDLTLPVTLLGLVSLFSGMAAYTGDLPWLVPIPIWAVLIGYIVAWFGARRKSPGIRMLEDHMILPPGGFGLWNATVKYEEITELDTFFREQGVVIKWPGGKRKLWSNQVEEILSELERRRSRVK